MVKNFITWSILKKKLDAVEGVAYAHPREIWWCSLGVNIGVETDGKNGNFERPVLVLRVYNKHSLLILPVTSKNKDDAFHFEVKSSKTNSWVKLTQVRVISNKRLLRKIDTLNKKEFEKLRKKFCQLI